MSAVEFGLASQSRFPHSFSQVPFEQPLTGPEALAARYELLSQLSRSIASMTPEDTSCKSCCTSTATVSLRFCERRDPQSRQERCSVDITWYYATCSLGQSYRGDHGVVDLRSGKAAVDCRLAKR